MKNRGKALVFAVVAALALAAAADAARAQGVTTEQRAKWVIPFMKEIGRGNCPAALRLVEQAKAEGDGFAFTSDGLMYFAGQCVERNIEKAIALYRLGARLEDSTAYIQLGHIYYNGEFLDKDIAAARRWFRRAALHLIYTPKGRRAAALEAKTPHTKGSDATKFMVEQIAWMEAIEKGGPAMWLKVSRSLYNGTDGFEKDWTSAESWLSKAAFAKFGEAEYELSKAIKSGRIYERYDPKGRPLFLLRSAGWHGYIPAMIELAEMYAVGNGVAQDDADAYEWYLRAKFAGVDVDEPLARFSSRLPDIVKKYIIKKVRKSPF